MKRAIALAMTIGWTGCAALVGVEGPASPPPHPKLDVEIAELRPNAVVLTARGDDMVHVELWRADAQEASLLQAADLDDDASSVFASGATLIDQAPIDVPATYTVVTHDRQGREHKAHVSVSWEPASSPVPVEAAFRPGIGVHLAWSSPSTGCLVLRRDVIANTSWAVVQRSATCHGEFIDVDVVANSVYAYRVATSDWLNGYPQYAQPSPELYITAIAPEPD